MKFALVFLIVCVALSAAAPQFFSWPYTTWAGAVAPATRTLVAGPTVVNGFGGTYAYPGFIGATAI